MGGPTIPGYLCDLPAEAINRTIGTQLDRAPVIISRAAQIHAARRHPIDYPRCFAHLPAIISNPLYIGDDAANAGKIELVSRPPGLDAFVLVAVNLERDDSGCYHVASFYVVSPQKIASRRAKGYLRVALKG